MITKNADIWHLKLDFLSPIKHSLATHQGSENLVVKLTTADGLSGYGEGIPRDFVTGETLPESLAFLQGVLVPAILGVNFASPQKVLQALAGLQESLGPGYPAAFCALEMALLDAAGRTWGRPVAEFIGPPRQEQVVYSAVLPMATAEQMLRFFKLVQAKKMRFLKLKVGDGDDLKILELAREILGWEVDLRVDANSAWSPAEAISRIRKMAPYRVSAVEQPVAKEDFEGLREVSQAVDLPIIADESLCTEADARQLIASRACQIFNIRLSKCGGLTRALKILRLAREAGLACQLGCHVGETSILAAAGRHFALCAEALAYVEGSLAPYLLAWDPVAQSVVFGDGGLAGGLPGPGLGVQVLDQALQELARAHWSS